MQQVFHVINQSRQTRKLPFPLIGAQDGVPVSQLAAATKDKPGQSVLCTGESLARNVDVLRRWVAGGGVGVSPPIPADMAQPPRPLPTRPATMPAAPTPDIHAMVQAAVEAQIRPLVAQIEQDRADREVLADALAESERQAEALRAELAVLKATQVQKAGA